MNDLTIEEWLAQNCDSRPYEAGIAYQQRGAVFNLLQIGHSLYGQVAGLKLIK